MDAADYGDDDDDNVDINNDDSMTSVYGSRGFHRWFNDVIPKPGRHLINIQIG